MNEIDQASALPLRTMKWTISETETVTGTRSQGPATASLYRRHKWAKSTPGEGAG